MPSAAERWVVNASPVIILAKVGHLSLFDDPCHSGERA